MSKRCFFANPYRRSKGFTLVELAVGLGVVICLAGIGLLSFRNQGETQDAILANSIHGSLQVALGQMTVRLERTPAEVFANFQNNMIQFAGANLNNNTTLTSTANGIQLQFVQSGRTVTYGINGIGDLIVVNENFNQFDPDVTGQLAEL